MVDNDDRPNIKSVVIACHREHRDLLRRIAKHDSKVMHEPRSMTATLGLVLREAAEKRGVKV